MWAIGALEALQMASMAWDFDLDEFKGWTLAYGDKCMANMGMTNLCEYPRRTPR
jgi:hypothetical protein